MKKGLLFFSLFLVVFLMTPVLLSSRILYRSEVPVVHRFGESVFADNQESRAPLSGTELQYALVIASHYRFKDLRSEHLSLTSFGHEKVLPRSDFNRSTVQKVLSAPITLPE